MQFGSESGSQRRERMTSQVKLQGDNGRRQQTTLVRKWRAKTHRHTHTNIHHSPTEHITSRL